ncbi:YcbK family protein, partial [Pseudomonas aeruginosa]|uniref:YcbK family protein n=1 Tax=Pseudomonas aeruginosa TaxID=287 RepID=UPI00106AC43F
ISGIPAYNPDPHLLDVLFIMQVWLQAYGQPSDIQILSGYRTPEHNGRLEGAAKNSLHMQGRAADIHIPGMSTQVLANMGKMIAVGGVGLYPSRGFIHVDTGSLRSWVG